ncbi:MAG: prolipoprotein diacylglyceryl transferase, partial [Pseudomonadales bacterium]|nr:prolipoprotein diacylglyceryl transferase [Pseudomonadales bacterium]
QLEDLVMYAAFGVVLGGRIGYSLFYGMDQVKENPLWIFKLWEGGMSFHGGLLGVMIAIWLYSRKIHRGFVVMMDFIAPMVPIGLGLGRLGNFINQELWGRVTTSDWGMIFPNDSFGLPRHPSQLYEFALEGVLLFIILYLYSAKPRPRYAVSAMFLVLYGCFRFFVEFFREPDAHIGFDLFDWLTRGQLLSVPMVIIGIILMLVAYHKDHPIHQENSKA